MSTENIVKNLQIYLSDEILSEMKFIDFQSSYAEIMMQLHGDEFLSTQIDLDKLLNNKNELIVFIVSDNKIISTAQGSFSQTYPVHHVYINNVVTLSAYRKQGLGRRSVNYLEREAIKLWSRVGHEIRFQLTNNPKKGSGAFFENIGYKKSNLMVFFKNT